jgi:hypothetical protein
VQIAVSREEMDRLRRDEVPLRRARTTRRLASDSRSPKRLPHVARQRTPRSQSRSNLAIPGEAPDAREQAVSGAGHAPVAAAASRARIEATRGGAGGILVCANRSAAPHPSDSSSTASRRSRNTASSASSHPGSMSSPCQRRLRPRGRAPRATARCPCPARSSPAARPVPAIAPRCPRACVRPSARSSLAARWRSWSACTRRASH